MGLPTFISTSTSQQEMSMGTRNMLVSVDRYIYVTCWPNDPTTLTIDAS